jgi:hypothetical protein
MDMTTIQIEAEVSTEQLLHAVERLPPQELAAFLAQLLVRVRSAAERPTEHNPYLAAAGIFADDAFAAEVEDFIKTQREREREEAARTTDT